MKIIGIVMFTLLLVWGCINRDLNELKDIPKHPEIKGEITRNTLGLHFSRGKSHNWQNTEVPHDIQMVLLDTSYNKVDYFYFLKFNKWFKKVKFENGLMPIDQNQALDCDNFAMLYKSLMGVSAYKSGDKLEMGIAVIVVRQVNEFGGIPGTGELHMLNLVFTPGKWIIYEPQTNEYILLEDYPNQEFVQYMIL